MTTPITSYQAILMPEKDVQENRNTISPLQPVVNHPSYMAPDWGGMSGKKNGGEVATQTQTKTTVPPPTDYKGMFDLLNENYAKKNEDIAKREEALKRAKTFATIGDALSAFHTAYSNARGVQSMVPAGTSLSGKWRERYDNLQKEREENDQAYLQGYQRIQQMKDTADYQSQSLALRKQQEERLQATAKAKIEYDLSRADAIKSKADLQAAESEAKIRLMEAGMSEKEASAQAKLIVANSTAAKNYAQAEKYRNSGGGGKNYGNVSDYVEEYTYDNRGRKVSKKVTRGTGNVSTSPPSRQSAKNNVVTAPDDKIPPSRRGKK